MFRMIWKRTLDILAALAVIGALALFVALKYHDPAAYAGYYRVILPILAAAGFAGVMIPLALNWWDVVTMIVSFELVVFAPVFANVLDRHGLWPVMNQRGWSEVFLTAVVLIMVALFYALPTWRECKAIARRFRLIILRRHEHITIIVGSDIPHDCPPLAH